MSARHYPLYCGLLTPQGAGDDPAPHLRIELFEGMRILIDGRVVHISSAKARALLAALVLSQSGEESRTTLAERIWSRSATAEHQRNSLKRDLKTLVDTLTLHGYRGLKGLRQTIRLDLATTGCDLLEALAAAEHGQAHAALLARLRPYETVGRGIDDVDPEFSAWLRERTRVLEGMTGRAIEMALARPGLEPAHRRDLAQAAFNLDPSRQPAALALMRVHESLDDLAAALQVYGSFYRAHLEEYDTPPTGEIVTELRRMKLTPRACPAPARSSAPAPRSSGLPIRLRIDPPQLREGSDERAIALAFIDRLSRRRGHVRIAGDAQATHRMQLLAAEGRLYVQLWRRTDRPELVWSSSARDTAEAEDLTARLIAALDPGEPARSPTGIAYHAPPQTFALRLVMSAPGALPPPPAAGSAGDGLDPRALVDSAWHDLMTGRQSVALQQLRRAALLDCDRGEVTGAAALGLALLGASDEAIACAEYLARHESDPALRAMRGITLAICLERRSAVVCLSQLPESWVLPRCVGAIAAGQLGNAAAVRRFLAPAPHWYSRLSPDELVDWLMALVPLPPTIEPPRYRGMLNALLCPATPPRAQG